VKDFFRNNGGLLLVIALLLSLLLGITSVFLSGTTDPISNVMTAVTAPFRNGVSAALAWAEGAYEYVFHYEQLHQELSDLKQQVADLEEALRDAEDATRENEQLRALLGLQEKHRDFVFEAVRVSSPSTSNWESTITISKGSAAGIEAGDCVVTETGALVGIVSQVSYSTSVVSTVINTDIEMGGMVSRTYSAGVLEGDFNLMQEGLLRLSYLSDGAQLVAGDEVVTSGMGEIYPSGFVVGRVEAVFSDPSGMTRYAVIQPAVDFSDLIEVFVIKEFSIEN